jgi:hypothetical protein
MEKGCRSHLVYPQVRPPPGEPQHRSGGAMDFEKAIGTRLGSGMTPDNPGQDQEVNMT